MSNSLEISRSVPWQLLYLGDAYFVHILLINIYKTNEPLTEHTAGVHHNQESGGSTLGVGMTLNGEGGGAGAGSVHTSAPLRGCTLEVGGGEYAVF